MIKSKWLEDKNIKKILIGLFVFSVICRTLLAINYCEVNTFYDELLHYQLSRSIAMNGSMTFRGLEKYKYDIVYYLLIAPAFVAKNALYCRYIIYFINSVLMSAAVFPLYGLSSFFIKRNEGRLLVCLYGLVIPELSYTGSIAQENAIYLIGMCYLYLFCGYESLLNKYGDCDLGKLRQISLLLGIASGVLFGTKDTGVLCVTLFTVALLIYSVIKMGKALIAYCARLLSTIVAIIGLTGGLLYRIKNIGILTAVILLMAVFGAYIFGRGNDSTRTYIVYCIGLFVSVILIGVVSHALFDNAKQPVDSLTKSMGNSRIVFIIIKIFDNICNYPGIVVNSVISMFLLFVIVTGLLPVIFIISGRYEEGWKRLFFYLIIMLIAIMSILVIAVTYDPEVIDPAIHYRYMFWLAPVVIIGFLYQIQERIETRGISGGQLRLFIIVGLIITVSHLFVSVLTCGHVFASISARPLEVLRNPAVYLIFKLACIGLIIVVAFMLRSKYSVLSLKVIMCVAMLGLIVINFANNIAQYSNMYTRFKAPHVEDMADAIILNGTLEGDKKCLVVGDNALSAGTFECYFNRDYYYTDRSQLSGDDGNIVLFQTSYIGEVDINTIDYVVSESDIPYLEGYGFDLYDIGLKHMRLYEK